MQIEIKTEDLYLLDKFTHKDFTDSRQLYNICLTKILNKYTLLATNGKSMICRILDDDEIIEHQEKDDELLPFCLYINKELSKFIKNCKANEKVVLDFVNNKIDFEVYSFNIAKLYKPVLDFEKFIKEWIEDDPIDIKGLKLNYDIKELSKFPDPVLEVINDRVTFVAIKGKQWYGFISTRFWDNQHLYNNFHELFRKENNNE